MSASELTPNSFSRLTNSSASRVEWPIVKIFKRVECSFLSVHGRRLTVVGCGLNRRRLSGCRLRVGGSRRRLRVPGSRVQSSRFSGSGLPGRGVPASGLCEGDGSRQDQPLSPSGGPHSSDQHTSGRGVEPAVRPFSAIAKGIPRFARDDRPKGVSFNRQPSTVNRQPSTVNRQPATRTSHLPDIKRRDPLFLLSPE